MSAMRNIYINFNLNPFTKLSSSSGITKFKYILQWNMSQMIMEPIPIKTTIVMSCAKKKVDPLWSVKESQWKQRQHGQNWREG